MLKVFKYGFLIISIACCSGSELRDINKKIKEYLPADIHKYNYILLIPNSGCHGCINSVESFMRESYSFDSNTRIFFILTGYPTAKNARIRFGNILENENIHLDTINRFSGFPFIDSYPLLLVFSDKEIVKRLEIKPSTSEDVFKLIN